MINNKIQRFKLLLIVTMIMTIAGCLVPKEVRAQAEDKIKEAEEHFRTVETLSVESIYIPPETLIDIKIFKGFPQFKGGAFATISLASGFRHAFRLFSNKLAEVTNTSFARDISLDTSE